MEETVVDKKVIQVKMKLTHWVEDRPTSNGYSLSILVLERKYNEHLFDITNNNFKDKAMKD